MIETTRKERKLLKKIIKLSKKYSDRNIPYGTPVPQSNYYLKLLLEKGLIQNSSSSSKSNSDIDTPEFTSTMQTFDSITPSTEGLHYLEINRDANITFFKKSILVPILVSVATTILIWLIVWLLGLLHLPTPK